MPKESPWNSLEWLIDQVLAEQPREGEQTTKSRPSNSPGGVDDQNSQGGADNQVLGEQAHEADRTTKSLQSNLARRSERPSSCRATSRGERTTKSQPSKLAWQSERPSLFQATLQGGEGDQVPAKQHRMSTKPRGRPNAADPRQCDKMRHHQTTSRPRVWCQKVPIETPMIRRHILPQANPHRRMGLVNLGHSGLNIGVSTVTCIPERTQQIHHTGHMPTHDGEWHRPVTTGGAMPRTTAPRDWPTGPTTHYYKDVSRGLATGIYMTNERDGMTYQ
jgi:hypothetical protein